MKIKELFEVLLTSQDVSLYNACGVLEWEGGGMQCTLNI